MPDGDVIDSLSLEIGASVNKSISAIKELQSELGILNGSLANFKDNGTYKKALDNLSQGFINLSQSIEWLDEKKITNTARALNALASASNKIDLTFGGKTTKIEQNSFGNQSKSIALATEKLKEYGRTFAEESWVNEAQHVEEISNSFVDYAKKVALFGEKSEEARASLEKLTQTAKMFASNEYLADDLIGDLPGYDVRSYLSAASSGGTKVLVNNDNEKGRDYARQRSVLGKAFSSAVDSSHQDMENFVSEMNSALGTQFGENVTDSTNLLEEVAEHVTNLDGKVKDLSRAEAEWGAETKVVKDLIDEIVPSMQTMIELAEQTFGAVSQSSGGGTVANTDNGFVALSQSIKELSGVKIPDLSQLEIFATSVGKFGNKSQTAGVENFPKAVTGLKELSDVTISDLTGLADFATSMGKLGNKGPTTASENIPKMADGLRALSDVTIPDFSGLSGLAQFMSSLGNKSPQRAVEVLPALIEFLTGLSFVQIPELTGIQNVSVAIKELGSANATKAAANLPSLTKALSDLMVMLGSLPDVSDKTIQLVTALGQLNASAVKGAVGAAKLASANQTLTPSYGALGMSTNEAALALKNMANWVMKCFTSVNTFKSGMNAVASGMKQIASAAINAGKGFVDLKGTLGGIKSAVGNLGVAFIKLRGIVWGFKRVASIFSGFTESASSLVEVQNVVRHVYDPTYIEEFNEASENTIETLGMSKLAFQQYASRYQAMGKALGITNSQMGEAEDRLKAMGVEYGTTSGKMGDMSVNLTRLAGDMASFYDVDVSSVQQSLQAVYTGQTRPLRQYGIDLTQATLKEWAMKQGLDADIESMTQAQKTMLRYQYVLSQGRAAMNDFARTSDTWHNQVTILKQSFIALSTVIGQGLINALKPALKGLNAFLNAAIDFSQQVVNALGKIFGWKYEITGGGIADETLADIEDASSALGGVGEDSGLSDMAGDVGDIADSLGDAADEAEKFKATILGFDELNVLNDISDAVSAATGGSPSGSGSGSGTGTGGDTSGLGGLGGGASNELEGHLEKIDSVFKSEIDNLYDLGKYISDTLKKTLDDIDWDKVYEKARNFGKGLAQFLNGLIQPDTFYTVGKTLANSLNTVVEAALAFTNEFNWKKAGKSLEQGFLGIFDNINWDNIFALADSLGTNLADYLNNLFTPELFSGAGRTLANSINTVFHFLDNFGKEFEWEEFGKSLSEGLATFIGSIEWEEALSAAKEWGTGVATALNSFIESGDEEKWKDVGRTIGNAIKTGLVAVISLTSEIHWDEVGHAVSDVINGALENISGKDVADAINGIVGGLNEAIAICKEDGTFDKVGHEIGEAIKGINWGEVITLLKDTAMLDLALGMASGLAWQLGQNPVKQVIEGGVGILGNVLSMALAMKLVGVGVGGGAATGAAAGSVAAGAAAAGTAIAGSLATGLIVGLPLIGISLALIHANITGSWDKTQIDQRYNYQKMGSNTTNYLDSEVSKTNTASGTIVKSYDAMGHEIGVLVKDSADSNSKKFSDYWDSVVGKSKKGKDDVVSNVYEEWTQHNKTVDEGTKEAIAKVSEYASDSATQFDNLKEKITGTTEETWSGASQTTSDYVAQISEAVSNATADVLGSADGNLSQLPNIFDSYFSQSTENALWHLEGFQSQASYYLNNVTSWLYDAINTANQASNMQIGPVAHWGGYYAGGGFPDSGTLFMARENASPEMVGRIGTRTAVANNDQIVAGIRAGVMDGMMEVLATTSGGGNSQPIVNEISVTCGEETLYQAVVRGKEKYDRRYQTVATIG
ncbi:MAG: hypothetical protein IKO36_08225 [Bacteroidaceae bacterium]|nr:hypothetical protein [Bacteroidaceae bacterium]